VRRIERRQSQGQAGENEQSPRQLGYEFHGTSPYQRDMRLLPL
jgi:hypothetical protein